MAARVKEAQEQWTEGAYARDLEAANVVSGMTRAYSQMTKLGYEELMEGLSDVREQQRD